MPILEENRENLMLEYNGVIINIHHSFYSDQHYATPYGDIVNLVSNIVMLYEELGVSAGGVLRFSNTHPISIKP